MNTKTPSGLSTARDGMKFTFSWKIADSNYNAGQEFQWRTNLDASGKWTTVAVNSQATSKSITLTATNYFPTTQKYLQTVSFRIRGKREPYQENSTTVTPDWSEWARLDYTVRVLATPTGSTELTSPTVTKFSWKAINNAKNSKPFYNVLWQSVRVKECNETDGTKITFSSSKPGWATNTSTSATGSHSITEDSVVVRNDSYTRWFRVRAQGARGHSDWKYLKHVYAYPKKPTIKTLRSSYSGGVTTLNLTWVAPSDAAHPIDSTTVEYCVEYPATGMQCPGTATWSEARTQQDTAASDGARVAVSAGPTTDQAMWVRLKNLHDANPEYSDAQFVRAGRLTTPTNVSVSTNSSTYKATITATNGSSVPDSQLAIIYRTDEPGSKDMIIGVIAHGSSSATVQCRVWAEDAHVAFGVYAFQGTYTSSTLSGVTTYAIKANMTSPTVWEGGAVPTAPSSLAAEVSDTQGEVILTWGWTWTEADATELSWSQNPNAWESTDEPQTYMITNLNQPKWRVSGLEVGKRWYFRARFANTSADDYNYGPYSDVVEVDLTSAPVVPVLSLSKPAIAAGDTFTASWVYTSTDGTPQAFADICEATVSAQGEISYGTIIAHATTAQHVDITPGWNTGTTHLLCVRVTSESGHVSDGWSAPVAITVADPISCTISATSLTSLTITDADSQSRTVTALRSMPLTVTVTGAGTTGQTTVIIERDGEYRMIRPDDTLTDGWDGETIAIFRQDGEAQISIGSDILVGRLDDGAQYLLIATVEDAYGQTASEEIQFEVHWQHQATVPTVTASVSSGVASIKATAPSGAVNGDVIDIYRLSADKPELIVQNGSYGTTYTDPYPTIGQHGGHRVVARTVNGDYITSSGTPAWTDTATYIDDYNIIVDFDGRQLILPYDITLQNKWTKDFKVTNYLGGSQQGDWNPAIDRTATYTFKLVDRLDGELIADLRTLSRYAGICHIRTPEGSSYTCDIQVTESQSFSDNGIVGFTLSVTRIDQEALDGR